MENLTLTESQYQGVLKAFGVVTILAFLVLLAFGLGASSASAGEIGRLIFRAASSAVAISGCVFWVFHRYAWRLWKFPEWLRRPVVSGTWAGSLTSDYKAEGDHSNVPIVLPIVFVIRQTFMTISIQSFTERQAGESRVEALILNPRTGHFRLAYVFELKNEYPGHNRLTNGAGDLRLYGDGTELRGQYWTDSPTHGTINLLKVDESSDSVQRFEDAKKKWPDHPAWTL